MTRRRIRSPRKDRRVFRQTANKTVAANVKPMIMRGGYRL